MRSKIFLILALVAFLSNSQNSLKVYLNTNDCISCNGSIASLYKFLRLGKIDVFLDKKDSIIATELFETYKVDFKKFNTIQYLATNVIKTKFSDGQSSYYHTQNNKVIKTGKVKDIINYLDDISAKIYLKEISDISFSFPYSQKNDIIYNKNKLIGLDLALNKFFVRYLDDINSKFSFEFKQDNILYKELLNKSNIDTNNLNQEILAMADYGIAPIRYEQFYYLNDTIFLLNRLAYLYPKVENPKDSVIDFKCVIGIYALKTKSISYFPINEKFDDGYEINNTNNFYFLNNTLNIPVFQSRLHVDTLPSKLFCKFKLNNNVFEQDGYSKLDLKKIYNSQSINYDTISTKIINNVLRFPNSSFLYLLQEKKLIDTKIKSLISAESYIVSITSNGLNILLINFIKDKYLLEKYSLQDDEYKLIDKFDLTKLTKEMKSIDLVDENKLIIINNKNIKTYEF